MSERQAKAPTMSALLPSRLVPEDMLSEWQGPNLPNTTNYAPPPDSMRGRMGDVLMQGIAALGGFTGLPMSGEGDRAALMGELLAAGMPLVGGLKALKGVKAAKSAMSPTQLKKALGDDVHELLANSPMEPVLENGKLFYYPDGRATRTAGGKQSLPVEDVLSWLKDDGPGGATAVSPDGDWQDLVSRSRTRLGISTTPASMPNGPNGPQQ